ncbi:MAG: ATP-grasp domain-containing protein [Alphaproteobacteria bacterium]|nr:ATP-grasp domain-containing protein [Alphaproteobacteria bacterium]
MKRLLIANRGEIACRIIATARRMGIATIAVHSEADRGALHVARADEAVEIGPAPAPESYLRAEALLAAARRTGSDAVHPGYGFLSENAGFAEAVTGAGLVFVGPPAAAIRAMGSKAEAKALMARAGVPVLPGWHGAAETEEALRSAAAGVGYPLMLKAVAGGGGKGMRRVEGPDGLIAAHAAAAREAKAAFGDGAVMLERCLDRPRHVEMQIFADSHGGTVHLFERDCSLQRRHQKVIEEAPAPGLAPAVRERMAEAAIAAARAVGYVGAGTVEFLLEGADRFYFLEMNTRLQVEHPVTEAITGLDLVEWQIRIARGEPLPLPQAGIAARGHAIEARLYAETPARGFLPSTGRLTRLSFGSAPGLRIDAGVAEGDTITPYYDPMIAKLIVHGQTREEARTRLMAALDGTQIAGPRTNARFLARLLAHAGFAAGAVHTGLITDAGPDLTADPGPAGPAFAAAAALWLAFHSRADDPDADNRHTDEMAGFRVNLAPSILVRIEWNGAELPVTLEPDRAGGARISNIDGVSMGRLDRNGNGRFTLVLDGHARPAAIAQTPRGLQILIGGEEHEIGLPERRTRDENALAAEGSLTAPMPGRVLAVKVEPDRTVEAGDPLLVLEAMKMEHVIRAPHAGTVRAVHFVAGDQVKEGDQLVDLIALPSAAS